MATKKRINVLKGEKFLYFMIVFLILGLVVGRSFSMAMLSKTNIEVESMRKKVSNQTSMNESLKMRINELASLDNIGEVANAYGLEYNNDNIRILSE